MANLKAQIGNAIGASTVTASADDMKNAQKLADWFEEECEEGKFSVPDGIYLVGSSEDVICGVPVQQGGGGFGGGGKRGASKKVETLAEKFAKLATSAQLKKAAELIDAEKGPYLAQSYESRTNVIWLTDKKPKASTGVKTVPDGSMIDDSRDFTYDTAVVEFNKAGVYLFVLNH